MKYILLNNLENKKCLLMKIGQFMSYFQKIISSDNSTKTAA